MEHGPIKIQSEHRTGGCARKTDRPDNAERHAHGSDSSDASLFLLQLDSCSLVQALVGGFAILQKVYSWFYVVVTKGGYRLPCASAGRVAIDHGDLVPGLSQADRTAEHEWTCPGQDNSFRILGLVRHVSDRMGRRQSGALKGVDRLADPFHFRIGQ